MQGRRLVFPFSAIVGLDKLKLAMLINAINPKIGGVLIRGPKGSGKSTIVRSLADILPKIRVVKDCPFNCNPSDPSGMCAVCAEKYKGREKSPEEERDMVLVDLPLGATEDRVVGSLDVEKAIKQGIEALEPGVLAAANQNILYVDEVNLLPDHIADDLLDAAATGWNIVEREGISVGHPSRFIFIGTMNPEEGELRPQLLDRFPLSITVGKIDSVKDRAEVVKRNIEFEADPQQFYEKYQPSQGELRNRIIQARQVLKEITLLGSLIEAICKACLDLKVDGLRPDIVISKAAATLAAFEGRTQVNMDDVLVAAELALSHRTREGGFVEPATPTEIREVFTAAVKQVFEFVKTGETTKENVDKRRFLKAKAFFLTVRGTSKEEEDKAQKRGKENSFSTRLRQMQLYLMMLINRLFGGLFLAIGKRLGKNPKNAPVTDGFHLGSKKLQGETYEKRSEFQRGKGIPTVSDAARSPTISQGFPVITETGKRIVSPSKFFLKMGRIKTKNPGVYAGKRAQAITTLNKGKPYGWKLPHGKPSDIHIPATIREAARWQKTREKPEGTALRIVLSDVREKLRSYKAPLTMVFVVDLSGSMLFNLEAVREALLRLHSDAYRSRDRVGIVALKGLNAMIVQHPITNLRVVANKLVNLRISGFTPLAAGMVKAWEVLREAKRRDPSTVPVMVIITDGSANVPLQKSLETGEIRKIEEVHVIVRDYEDLATRDAASASRMIRRAGINTIIVNTNPHRYSRETYGLVVTETIASITHGSLHTLGRLPKELNVENMIDQIREDQRKIVYERMLG
jgi:magnesium chelatase subunit D